MSDVSVGLFVFHDGTAQEALIIIPRAFIGKKIPQKTERLIVYN